MEMSDVRTHGSRRALRALLTMRFLFLPHPEERAQPASRGSRRALRALLTMRFLFLPHPEERAQPAARRMSREAARGARATSGGPTHSSRRRIAHSRGVERKRGGGAQGLL